VENKLLFGVVVICLMGSIGFIYLVAGGDAPQFVKNHQLLREIIGINEKSLTEQPVSIISQKNEFEMRQTEYSNGIIVTEIGGFKQGYEDGSWKPLEQLRSFINSTPITCQIKYDGVYDAKCKDYNMTSITLENIGHVDSKDKITKDIPIKTYVDGKEVKAKEIIISLKDKTEKKTLTIPYEWGSEIHIGEKSTTVTLLTPNTQVLDDTYDNSSNVTENYGQLANFYMIKNSGTNMSVMSKYNLSSINNSRYTIVAQLRWFVNTSNNLLDNRNEGFVVRSWKINENLYSINGGLWVEGNGSVCANQDYCYNFRPNSSVLSNVSNDFYYSGGDGEYAGVRVNPSINNMIIDSLNKNEKNISIYTEAYDYWGSPDNSDTVRWNSKSSLSASPSLIIIQSTKIAPTNPNITFNSTSGLNSTTDNITAIYYGSNDSEGDSIINITNWKLNGSNILVGNFPFEENSIIENYGNPNSFGTTILGTAWNATGGKVGAGYLFDGTNDYVDFFDQDKYNVNSLTLSFWIKTRSTSITTKQPIITKRETTDVQSSYEANINNNGTLEFGVHLNGNKNITYLNSTVKVNDTNWSHIVTRYNKTTGNITIFVNGVLRSQITNATTGVQASNISLRFGRVNAGSSGAYNGSLDEVLIFNRSITDEQIWQLYQDGLNGVHHNTIVSSETEIGDVWTAEVYARDTETKNFTSRNITILAGGVNSCTYTSGNWNVLCSDNCVISSPVNVGGNNISITGTGTFKTTANISNYKFLHREGTSSTNRCNVTCSGGCFIK